MKIKNNSRDAAIDILKVFALIHMIYDHLYITLYNNSIQIPVIDFIDNIIPLCPALFLFLSGYSLTIGQSYLKVKKRLLFSLFLMFTGSIFFIAENGFQFPDFIFSPGILYTIGLNTIICTLIGTTKKYKILIISSLAILSSLAFISLRLANNNLFHLTTGYEPFFPTVIYGFFGFLYGELKRDGLLTKWAKTIIFGVSIVIFSVYSYIYGIFAPLYPDVGRYTIERIFNSSYFLPDIFLKTHTASFFTARIWNFDILCFVYSLSLVFILVICCDYLINFQKIKINKLITLPAQYLLFNYIFHLSVIALSTQIIGFGKLSLLSFIMYYCILIIVIYLLNLIFIINKKNHQGISPE